MKSALSAARKDASDIVGQILQIPLVDQSVDLSGFFITLIFAVCMVNNTDKPNTPERKQPVDIFFYQLQFAGKTRLRLAQDNLKFSLLCICQQTLL